MEIIEVNNLIRGLIVPPGEFIFEMIFEPNDLKYGSFFNVFILFINIDFIVF